MSETTQRLNGLLAALGERTGHELSLNSQGFCSVPYGEDDFFAVRSLDEPRAVLLQFPIMEMTGQGGVDALITRCAMRLNGMLAGTGGSSLCLEDGGKILCLEYAHLVNSLDGDAFANLVVLFLDAAEQTRARLAEDITGALPMEGDEEAPPAMPQSYA
jgi:hypothetical protein